MTLYTGQNLTTVIPMEGEHPDGTLLFSEHDRRKAYSFLQDRPRIPASEIEDATEFASHLADIVNANNSHQADYLLKQLLQTAREQGVDLLPQVEIQSVTE